MAPQIIGVSIVCSTVVSGADQRGEFTWGRWIPRTKGQQRGKCFHMMTLTWDKTVWEDNDSVLVHDYNFKKVTACQLYGCLYHGSWWRDQMEAFRATGLWGGNSPVTGEFPSQRPVIRSFNVVFDLRLNKHLSKQLRGWWFETPSRSSWRHCYDHRCRGESPSSGTR